MSKWTPGPWTLGKRGRYKQWIDGDNWHKLASVYVCIQGDDDVPFPDDEGQANARLIAAAPDLADALKEAVNCYGKLGGPWNVPSDPGGWLERARAALRKAGEI